MSWITERISANKREYAVHCWYGPRNAPVIIALHGFTGAGQDFAVLAERPGNPYTWICPDCLGHGDSHAPELLSAYSLDNFLIMLDAVVQKYATTGRPILLGYSLGGRLAMHWTMRNSKQLAGLVIVGATPGLETPVDRAERVKLDQNRAARIKRFGVEDFIKDWMTDPLIATQSRMLEPWKSALISRREKNTAAGLIGALTGWGAGVLPSLWSDLEKIACPVLILTGIEDKKYTGLAARMARNLRQSRNEQIAGAGHAPHLEAPQRVLLAVGEFVKSL